MKLPDIKSNANTQVITLIKQSMHSAMPIKEDYWQTILDMNDTSI